MEKMTFREYALAKTAGEYGFSPYMGYPERGTLENDAGAGALATGVLSAGAVANWLWPKLSRDPDVEKVLETFPVMENGRLKGRWKAAGLLGAGLVGAVPGAALGAVHHGIRGLFFDD